MKIPDNHLTALVRHFQAEDDALHVDGIYGRRTADKLDLYIRGNAPLMDRAWESALRDVGKKGNFGTNNVSQYIRSLRGLCDFPIDAKGPWCGVFQSAHLLRAGIPIRSRGAYRLCETMANHKDGFEETQGLEDGRVYLACWKRGRWDTHQEAHVRMVRSNGNMVEYIGGNEPGDIVCKGLMSFGAFEKDLIMVSGWSI